MYPSLSEAKNIESIFKLIPRCRNYILCMTVITTVVIHYCSSSVSFRNFGLYTFHKPFLQIKEKKTTYVSLVGSSRWLKWRWDVLNTWFASHPPLNQIYVEILADKSSMDGLSLVETRNILKNYEEARFSNFFR